MTTISIYLRSLFMCSVLSSCSLFTPLLIEEAEEEVGDVIVFEIEKHEGKK